MIRQKRAIRVIARMSSREQQQHTGPIFSRLNILNSEQIKTFQVGEFMYRYHHGIYTSRYGIYTSRWYRYLWLLGVALNLVLKYIPTSPEMPVPVGLLSPALTLAYSLLNMLAL